MDHPQGRTLVERLLNVAADYGLAVMRPASPAARRFAAWLLAAPARLRGQGFASP
jgi:hypothetical protein